MAPDLRLLALHIELAEWLLNGANGDCMMQLLRASENKNATEAVLYIDIMLLTDYNPELAAKFLFDFGQIYFVLNEVIQAFLRSKLFDISSHNENPLELVVRFCNHPSPPRKFLLPSKSDIRFISYLGLVVECNAPEDIGPELNADLFFCLLPFNCYDLIGIF